MKSSDASGKRLHTVVHCCVLIAGIATTGCHTPTAPPLPAGGIHVLFVGNSLTYTNDLPGTLAAIAEMTSDTIRVASATGADVALIDHINGGSDALARLRNEKWDYVILQQGPTPAGVCRDSLVLWTRLFDPYIRMAGAIPAVLMTWPGVGHQNLWPEVRVSFQAAASGDDAVFLPAGEAWRNALGTAPSVPLYGGDGYHPSFAGTALAALEIYERMTGRDARALPWRGFSRISPDIDSASVAALLAAAHDANASFGPKSAPTGEELSRPSLYVMPSPHC